MDLFAAGDPPAFATDSRDRIVLWNRGAATVLGRRSDQVLGRRCYEVLCGRDVFDNRLCYQNCPVSALARADEPISGFEMRVPSPRPESAPLLLNVTILCQAGRPLQAGDDLDRVQEGVGAEVGVAAGGRLIAAGRIPWGRVA